MIHPGFVWLWLFLSDLLNPTIVENHADFWPAKLRQLFSVNSHIGDPFRLIGNAVISMLLWLLIDWLIRHIGRSKPKPNKQ